MDKLYRCKLKFVAEVSWLHESPLRLLFPRLCRVVRLDNFLSTFPFLSDVPEGVSGVESCVQKKSQ